MASPTVSLSLTTTVPRSCCVVPALTKASATMTKGASVGPYTFYSGNYTLDPALKSSSKFDVSVSGGGDLIADTFKSTANLGPTCVPFGSENSTLPERSYSGCFTDNVASRALTGAAFQDNQLTIDKCAALCESYQFFGLEYGRECFCGNTQSSSSSRVEHSECNAPCSGDVSEVCGAPDRLSLYKNLAWVPTLNPNITGYIYYGCHSDSPRDRALSERFVYDVRMTVEKCASFCNGTTYFGVEYYSECYCGASLSQSSTIRPETDCGFFCSGNSTQYCGGSGRINLYQRSNVTLSNLAVV